MLDEPQSLPPHLLAHLHLDAEPGPAAPLSEVAARAQVAAALQAVHAPDVVDAADAAAPPRRTRRRLALPWALGLLAAGASAAAAMVTGALPNWWATDTAGEPQATAAPHRPVEAPAPPTANPPADPTSDTPAPQTAAETPPAHAPDRVSQRPAAKRPSSVPRPSTAGTRMAEANRLRGLGRYRQAERNYRRAANADPSVAHVAWVAAADLRRERLGDPKGALALYRRALSAGGPLEVEALRGLALSHGALGQPAAERQALRRLVAHSADGATADWARERLRALDADAPP